jgi:hypothetical protein
MIFNQIEKSRNGNTDEGGGFALTGKGFDLAMGS